MRNHPARIDQKENQGDTEIPKLPSPWGLFADSRRHDLLLRQLHQETGKNQSPGQRNVGVAGDSPLRATPPVKAEPGVEPLPLGARAPLEGGVQKPQAWAWLLVVWDKWYPQESASTGSVKKGTFLLLHNHSYQIFQMQ